MGYLQYIEDNVNGKNHIFLFYTFRKSGLAYHLGNKVQQQLRQPA